MIHFRPLTFVVVLSTYVSDVTCLFVLGKSTTVTAAQASYCWSQGSGAVRCASCDYQGCFGPFGPSTTSPCVNICNSLPGKPPCYVRGGTIPGICQFSPTVTPTYSPTRVPTYAPTIRPVIHPSSQPSSRPSRPSSQPSMQPSALPSRQPTMQPSSQPSQQPTRQPSSHPTRPSSQPSREPTYHPPTLIPTHLPTPVPTPIPTLLPSRNPVYAPTLIPTTLLSSTPTAEPSNPTGQPSGQPSIRPSSQPSQQPSKQPTMQPSRHPSSQPNRVPTTQPSMQPSRQPSMQPSRQPSMQPSRQPSQQPTAHPSRQPSSQPSRQPGSQPTRQPSQQPKNSPTSPPSCQPTTMPSKNDLTETPTKSFQPTTLPTSLQPTSSPSWVFPYVASGCTGDVNQCYGYNCDQLLSYFGISCDEAVDYYLCDCSGCTCGGLPSSTEPDVDAYYYGPESVTPTMEPTTTQPTARPSVKATQTPTIKPSVPTLKPSMDPTAFPLSPSPTVVAVPSLHPTDRSPPSSQPTTYIYDGLVVDTSLVLNSPLVTCALFATNNFKLGFIDALVATLGLVSRKSISNLMTPDCVSAASGRSHRFLSDFEGGHPFDAVFDSLSETTEDESESNTSGSSSIEEEGGRRSSTGKGIYGVEEEDVSDSSRRLQQTPSSSGLTLSFWVRNIHSDVQYSVFAGQIQATLGNSPLDLSAIQVNVDSRRARRTLEGDETDGVVLAPGPSLRRLTVSLGHIAVASITTVFIPFPTSQPTSAPSYVAASWGEVVSDKLRKRHRSNAGYCDNDCSHHGVCIKNINCLCHTNLRGEPLWTGPDCSQRMCPSDFAWVGEVVASNDLHPWAECSNKGLCDRKTGICNCFVGYDGVACQRTVCPADCSGRGICLPLKMLARRAGRVYDLPWDAKKQLGCFCDPGFRGPACDLRECPSGSDPRGGYGNEAGRDCSCRGLCDYSSGTCQCFVGFFGTSCQYRSVGL